jgi:hypothetical protein
VDDGFLFFFLDRSSTHSNALLYTHPHKFKSNPTEVLGEMETEAECHQGRGGLRNTLDSALADTDNAWKQAFTGSGAERLI